VDSRLILGELRRRLAQQPGDGWTAAKLIKLCHPKQAAFVGDKSRRKAALCSRRAGKSFGLLVWFIVGAITDPGGLSVFICRTKGDARRILEPAVMELRERTGMALPFYERDGQLMLGLPGRHQLWLAGCKDQSEVGKFRGAGKGYRRAAVDEAQEFADDVLRKLVLGALEPALLDKHGDLAITGTPGPIPAGLFHEITTGEGGTKWPTHAWTIHDNPHIQDAEAELAAYLKQYGLTPDAPVFIREWRGLWVYDASALVYPFVGDKNACKADEIPTEGAAWVLGIDLGSSSATAFVLGCIVPGQAHVYIVSAAKHENWIPSRIAAEVERYRKATPGLRVVVDEGGLGRGYAQEMRERYGIPCEAAEKTKKRGFQEIVAGELRSATIKIEAWACRELLDEMSILQWLPDRSEEDSARFANHACDAFLYCVRALRSGYNPQLEPPKPGTPEWWAQQREKERAAARDRGRKRQRGFKRVALREALPGVVELMPLAFRDAQPASRTRFHAASAGHQPETPALLAA
jgi:hypothetical protein